MAAIGVVVPVYKVERYLDRCVASILKQTFRDFQLILVNDGSPDNSGALCDQWAERDSRIHVIHQSNGGLSAARNAGLEYLFAHTDFQWVTFVDSDDWIHETMLETLLCAAGEHQVKISVCNYEETQGPEPLVELRQESISRFTAEDFYRSHFINATIACGKLYCRECFETVRFPLGKLHEDEFVTYRVLFDCGDLAFVDAPMYAYYVNTEGITKNGWSPRRLDAWEAYEQQIAYFEKNNYPEMVRFRYRGYLENGMVNLQNAENANEDGRYDRQIRFMEKRMRNVIRRAWKRNVIRFWPDFDMLYRFWPVMSKVYRLYIEIKDRF